MPRANLFATAKGNTVRQDFRSRAGGEGSEALKVDFIPRVKAANALAEVSFSRGPLQVVGLPRQQTLPQQREPCRG